MTNPLSSLVQEHRTIVRLSDALEAYAEQIGREEQPPADDLAQFAQVFRVFVDHVHHEKEESVLLPFVVENGFDWDAGTVPEIRREHRQERYLIEVLAQASERAGDWTADDRRRIVETARAIVEFEREHLGKENREFFPKILADLSPEAQRELGSRLQRFDTAPDVQQSGAEMKRLATRLIERYAPGSSSPPAVA